MIGVQSTFDVVVAGNYAYVANAGAGLRVIDISNPVHPVEIGSYDTPGYARDLAVAGNIVYIADEWEGLRVLDISDRRHPREVGFYKTRGQAFGVAVVDKKVYVADAFAGLSAVDVSNPATPTEVGIYEVKGHAGQVGVAGGIAYVADRDWGLRAVDVTDPTRPRQVGFYSPLGYASDVAVAGNYAYVAAGYYGMRVVDISDPAHPTQVGVYSAPGYTISVAVADGYAYVATVNNGLHVVDISNPANPTKAGFYEHKGVGSYRDMAVVEGIAYIPDEYGLKLISVSNPVSPVQLGFIRLCEPPFPAGGSATVGVDVSGDLAYVAMHGGVSDFAGLKIVDVSDTSNLKLVGIIDLHFSLDVVVVGNYAYVADGWHGMDVVDIRDPTHPVVIGSYDTPREAYGIAVSGNWAYVADADGGLQLVDVSEPSSPKLVGFYNTRGFAHKVIVSSDHVFVADGDGGMLILEANSSTGTAHYEPNSHSEISGKLAVSANGLTTQVAVPLNTSKLGGTYPAATPHASSATVLSNIATQPVQLIISDGAASAGDRASYSSGKTLTVTSAADSGPGSLRWSLEGAVSGDTIVFDRAIFPSDNPTSITLSEKLPGITQGNLTIDASDSGVILDGSKLTGEGHAGLFIVSDGNIVKGLQILNFTGDGVNIVDGAKHNVIGGNRNKGIGPTGEGNLISGNGRGGWGNGIGIGGRGTMYNIIVGNLIGTDASGTNALGNNDFGVFIVEGASHNRIGGTNPGERNIISSNRGNGGVGLGAMANGNIVVGNYIGTDISGTTDLGNLGYGVGMEVGAPNNLIKGNVISANKRGGVLISDWGSSYNTVIGNLIGTDASGTLPLGNDWVGVFVGFMGASFNRIGGTTAEERNIISGNNRGVDLHGSRDVGNLVIGNYIGTDISGTRAIGNLLEGILVSGTSERVFIGGVTEGERNVISGNGNGIRLGNDWNWVVGNYIGTDASGMGALGNNQFGILINGADHNAIQANVISSNKQGGIRLGNAKNNALFHNNLTFNRQNAFDDTDANFWDHSTKGNYWSDYTGKDANGDGIGDTPYPVSPSGVDKYPLTQPYKP